MRHFDCVLDERDKHTDMANSGVSILCVHGPTNMGWRLYDRCVADGYQEALLALADDIQWHYQDRHPDEPIDENPF